MWCLIADIYKLGVGSLYTHGSKRNYCNSLLDSNNLFYLECCNYVFMSVLVYKNSQRVIYRQPPPYRALINQDGRPNIADAPLMVIFKMGKKACHFVFCPFRQPIPHLWMSSPNSLSEYPSGKTKHCSHSVDAHFPNGAGNVSLLFLIIQVANPSKIDNDIWKSILCN